MLMLFGRAVSGISLMMDRVLVSTTSRVTLASLLKYRRLPSGAAAAPWLTGMPVISPTILWVDGSIRWITWSRELVCTMRTVSAWLRPGPVSASTRTSSFFMFISNPPLLLVVGAGAEVPLQIRGYCLGLLRANGSSVTAHGVNHGQPFSLAPVPLVSRNAAQVMAARAAGEQDLAALSFRQFDTRRIATGRSGWLGRDRARTEAQGKHCCQPTAR